MGINVLVINERYKVLHMAGLAGFENHIVEREHPFSRTVAVDDLRLQHQAALLVEIAGQNRIDSLEHVLRRHIGQKTEPAEIDAQQRHVLSRDDAGRVQQGPVAANGDHQIDGFRQIRSRKAFDIAQLGGNAFLLQQKNVDTEAAKMSYNACCGIGDFFVSESSP